ncbi:MAG: metallophosphoesterase [Lachnospiraceae bacterium]|nr:metallophosphoesterase [Lachnospiraceae bacterium]
MFFVLAIILLILMVFVCMYLFSQFQAFNLVKTLSKGDRKKSRLLAAIPFIFIIIFGFISPVNTIVVVLHLFIFWLVFDLVFFVKSKLNPGSKNSERSDHQRYYAGNAALIFTAIYLLIGVYNNYNVRETHYTVTTEKDLGAEKLRVVQISDSHLGTTFDGNGFAALLKQIQLTDPDIVVITGDYVDDGTKRDDMLLATKALGELKSTYGTYFIFGNHDKGYFNSRDFSSTDLINELEKNGIRVLEDDSILIDNRFYLIGRADKSNPLRKSARDMMSGLDKSKFSLVLDHQPNDYDNEAEANMDLVLSGHTHGGQLFPIGYIGLAIGANDRTYGREIRNGTQFIVNSGISDWELIFKTFTFSEYAVIDIKNAP